MAFSGKMDISGEVEFQVIRPHIRNAPLSWKLRNNTRPAFIKGWIVAKIIFPFAKRLRLPVLMGYGELSIRHHNGATGEWTDYGVVSRQVITDAGVAFLVDDWDGGANDFSLFNFHGIGTGAAAEAVGNTALGTESTTALNPDSTRATGTKSQPTANQMRSIGTLTCDADIAVTEHGFFSTSGTGTGTLWDRSVFAVINLVGANPDSIQCTYTGTFSAGG
jgi:hypothetical protein